jgi:beta-aspartyl-peptidase (threonine type)
MSKETRPCIAVTLNGREAAARGMEVLAGGGSALDAVEAAVRVIEANPEDWSVGPGGLPNFAGVVELDAAIACGRTLRTGAVAGLRRHGHPVSVARKVMEETPHVLLIGEGADRFADAQGFPSEEVLTDRVRGAYEKLMREEPIELWPRVPEESAERALKYGERLLEVVRSRQGWKEIFCAELQGTCNALALDRSGEMASAVSTSGLALKMPGRVGDSPVPGAGNHCDGRFGAAGCAGNGELCLRLASARSAVEALRGGRGAREAAESTVLEMLELPDRSGGFQVLVMDRGGEAWCASNIKEPEYYFMTEGDAAPRRTKGSYVEVKPTSGEIRLS